MRTNPVQRNIALFRVAVAVVLFSIVSAPALSATPRPNDAPRLVGTSDPVAWFGQWLDELTTELQSVWQTSGCKIDPNGSTCTEGAAAPPSSAVENEDGLKSSDSPGY